MDMNGEYIEKILQKLNDLQDDDLKELILKLVDERNYLVDTIKIDPLTGSFNRRILDDIKNCSVLVMCDIDNFKNVNDVYGHDIGDKVIKTVSQILSKNTRVNDYVCRYGGDEFLVAFFGCDEQVVLQRMEKVREEVSNSILLSDCKVTISVGLAANNDNEELDDLIERADEALYDSKELGKDSVTVFKKNKSYVR